MNGWWTAAAAAIVRLWTWLYTLPLDVTARHDRRREIESDLWEFRTDREREAPLASAAHLIVRAALGVPDDLFWACEQLSVDFDLPRVSTVVRFSTLVIAAATVVVSASGPSLDAARAVKVNVDAAGWLTDTDADSTSAVAPAFAFTLTNISNRPTAALQVNAVFYRGSAKDARFGTAFAPVVGWRGLGPGMTSARVVLRGQGWRIAGREPAQRRPSVGEASVKLFLQHEGRWTLLGNFAIPARRLQP